VVMIFFIERKGSDVTEGVGCLDDILVKIFTWLLVTTFCICVEVKLEDIDDWIDCLGDELSEKFSGPVMAFSFSDGFKWRALVNGEDWLDDKLTGESM